MKTPSSLRDILILTQYYTPEPGAPQIRLRQLAKHLQSHGVSVRVLTGMPNYPEGRIFDGYRGRLTCEEQIEGIPVRRLWLYPAAGRRPLRRLLNYLSFSVAAIPALLLTKRSALVFVEAQPVTLALAAWINKVIRGVPYVYNTPDLQVEISGEAGWVGGSVVALAAKLEAFLMRQALSVSTVTHAFIRHFVSTRGVPEDRFTFLPNGADVDILRPLPRDEALAKRLGVGPQQRVFTYAGTHAHYQGLESILDAAALLKHRPDISILMVGKGPVREQLIARASKEGLTNVLFRDSPFEETAQLMSLTCASLVVLKDIPASSKMRLSKAIPPLACGVPVIYAGRGETAEILLREGCGLTVLPERPELLAQAIELLADDATQRERMGRRARELAVRDFSWRYLVGDWLRQIEHVAKGLSPAIPGFSGQETPEAKSSAR